MRPRVCVRKAEVERRDDNHRVKTELRSDMKHPHVKQDWNETGLHVHYLIAIKWTLASQAVYNTYRGGNCQPIIQQYAGI
jgi:hypothetical protein